MSDATFRHVNALSMKYELLREIKHWKTSSKKCIADVTSNMRSLRESRATVKREINATRARLEERLRQLEEISEKQTLELADAEEEIMKNFIKKLVDRHKRLEATESLLKENLIGFKLKRALDDGKHQTLALREAIMETKKYDLADGMDFKLKEILYAITEQLDSLGTVTLVNSVSTKPCNSKPTIKGAKRGEQKIVTNGTPVDSNGTVEVIRSDSIEKTMLNDLEFILEMDTKYEHSLKPFLDSLKDVSLKYNTDKNGTIPNVSSSKLIGNTTLIDCAQNPLKPAIRSYSAKPEAKEEPKLLTRLSKSAREDGRMPGACLNDLEIAYAHSEEQGPESVFRLVKKKKNHSVRYHDFDFVKEISAIKEDAFNAKGGAIFLTNSAASSDGAPSENSRQPSPGSLSINSMTNSLSSVSYKPSSSLASGPVYISPSEQSKSYFRYMAKFHTKKHPYETDLCRLTGIVVLDNGQIVVSDINHLQIMLFGPEFMYLDSLDCPSPCGLGHVADNVVAVTLFHNRKIFHVKVHTIHLERHKEFHVPCQESLISVRYYNGRYFVLCFAGDIHVLDDDGRQTSILETKISAGEARHMDINNDASLIFISGNDRVSCFDDSGQKLWHFSCSTYHRRFTPGDIVYFHERLFVADWSGHKVLELSMEGSYVRDVIEDNVEFPHAMAAQKNHARIFITQSNFFKQEARSRSIKVFEIK